MCAASFPQETILRALLVVLLLRFLALLLHPALQFVLYPCKAAAKAAIKENEEEEARQFEVHPGAVVPDLPTYPAAGPGADNGPTPSGVPMAALAPGVVPAVESLPQPGLDMHGQLVGGGLHLMRAEVGCLIGPLQQLFLVLFMQHFWHLLIR